MSTAIETIELKRAKLAMLRIVTDEKRFAYYEYVDKVNQLEREIYDLEHQLPAKSDV